MKLIIGRNWRKNYLILFLDAQGGLSIAVGHPYEHSHRHFSHLLAIHPLGLLDKSYGKSDSQIIDVSLIH